MSDAGCSIGPVRVSSGGFMRLFPCIGQNRQGVANEGASTRDWPGAARLQLPMVTPGRSRARQRRMHGSTEGRRVTGISTQSVHEAR